MVPGTPAASGATGGTSPFGSLDGAQGGLGTVSVTGWSIDPDVAGPIDVLVVLGGVGHTVTANGSRPDVAAVYPASGAAHGYSASFPAPAGEQGVCVYALNQGPGVNVLLGCRTVKVRVASPFGSLDGAQGGLGTVSVTGWSIDPDVAGPIEVLVVLGGVGHAVTANGSRPDVAAVYPASGAAHGYSASFPAPAGEQGVCVYALNQGPGVNVLLGCRTVKVRVASPFGSLDGAQGGLGTVSVTGWSIDPDVAGPIEVLVVLGGVGHAVTANGSRPDVAAVYPASGAAHGYSASFPAPAGEQGVCVYALNQGPGVNVLLGCRTVKVRVASPFGSLDVVQGGSGTITVAGWAIDPDTLDPISVRLDVDGADTSVIADRSRPDVGAAYPAFGPGHGFAGTVAASPGSHTVCAYGIDVGPGEDKLLGCRAALVIPPYEGKPGGEKVAVLGNSIVALSAEEIPRALNDAYQSSVMGESGFTIEQLLPLAARYAATNPAVAVIEAGSNDAGRTDVPWSSDDELNIEGQMIQRFPAARCIVWVNIKSNGPNGTFNDHAVELNDGLLTWQAREPRLIVLDWDGVTADHPEYFYADAIHPNQAGQDLMAELIRTAVDGCPSAPPRRFPDGGSEVLRAADQAARAGAGVLAVAVDDLARHDRGDVALGLLHEALPAGRQVADHLGRCRRRAVEVDDVHVGPVARSEHATVVQADEGGGVGALPLHHPLDRKRSSSGASRAQYVIRNVGKLRRR